MTAMQYLNKAGIFSTHLAIGCFCFGTMLLIIYWLFPNLQSVAVIVGLCFIILATIINTIVFLYLFYCFVMHKVYREYFAVKMLIMLANIPIVILYFFLIITNFNL